MNTDGRTQSQLFIFISFFFFLLLLFGFLCEYCFAVVKKA